MGNQWFQFKQFKINQDKTAMKVGTDGTLLGAWTNVPSAGKALDVGTGTGLIALMVAQRAPEINVTAIDIEENAFVQATENVLDSKFSDRITVVHKSFVEFANDSNEKYDLIVCNPPFYQTSNPGENKERAIARHANSLRLDELIFHASHILSDTGIISLILPSEQLNIVEKLIVDNNLFVQKITFLKPIPTKDPHRILVQLGKETNNFDNSTIIIEEFGRHQYSDDFKALVAPFYLNF